MEIGKDGAASFCELALVGKVFVDVAHSAKNTEERAGCRICFVECYQFFVVVSDAEPPFPSPLDFKSEALARLGGLEINLLAITPGGSWNAGTRKLAAHRVSPRH